jgi:tetratricopeptide (TPR) repeat protein
MIMVVSLIGAVFAFLQTSASNRSFEAARRSDAAAVEAEGEAALASSRIAATWRIWTLILEEGQTSVALGTTGEGDAAGLAAGFRAAAMAMTGFADVDLTGGFSGEWARYFAGTWQPLYLKAEWQKAHAAERDGWADKSGDYVAVVTVLAVALFLIGLSRTPAAAASAGVLVGAGVVLAVAAAAWGLAILARPVAGPSAEAIDAYVEGRVALDSATQADDLQRADEAFGRALAARPGYVDANFSRGFARFRADFVREGGPVGSEGARDDFAAVTRLDPLNAVAWNNLAAARFWLGDLAGAEAAIRTSLRIDPRSLLANLNLSFFRLISGDEAGYEEQMSVVRGVFEGGEVHVSNRDYVVAVASDALGAAVRYRPAYADAARRLWEDLLRLHHQTAIAERYFGTSAPPPVAVTAGAPTFTLSDDRTSLVASFAVTGVVEGQRWLWRTYRGGVEDASMSSEPQSWAFGVPDEELEITLTLDGGFPAGVPVRVEVFFEAALVQAGEFTP